MTHNNSSRSHLVPLKGTGWSLWREGLLRGAGFPAHDILLLRDLEAAAAADATTPENVSAALYQNAFMAASNRTMAAVSEIAGQPLFREAVAWQNPVMITNCLDPLLVKRTANTGTRSKQVRLAMYFQRYTLKNDTIGFFGPIAWATVDDQLEGFTALPGPDLLTQRATYFEVWAIDAVAHAFGCTPGVESWIIPERAPGSMLIDGTLYRARRRPHELSDVETQIWHACDGQTFVKDVIGDGPDAAARSDALKRLRESEAIIVDLEGGVSSKPEVELRRKLELIGVEPLRTEMLAKLDQLVAARDELGRARSAGEVMEATKAIEQHFRAITGAVETSRRHGKMYAGRTLVYQDTVRDVELVIGKLVIDQLARPLGLILDSVRWLIGRAGAIYRALLTEQVRAAAIRLERDDIPLGYLITCLSPQLIENEAGDLPEPMRELVKDFQVRWSRVLGQFPLDAGALEFSSTQLAEAVAREFPYLPSPWVGANTHSPDLMIAAPSPEAIAAGNFLLVLGELHLARNTLESRCFVELHPNPNRLIAAQGADMPRDRFLGLHPKDSPYVTSRCAPPTTLLAPNFTYWTWSDSRASTEVPGGILPGADLYACDSADGALAFSRSTGQAFDIFHVLGDTISSAVVNAFCPLAPAAHLPRITIDNMVMQRETWTIQMQDMEWMFLRDEAASFAAARRWRAHLGMPERVFVKVPGEVKPMAVDFASPLLLRMLGRTLRRAQEAGYESVTVAEMLPVIEEVWLADAEGHRYTSEIRLVVVDEKDGLAYD